MGLLQLATTVIVIDAALLAGAKAGIALRYLYPDRWPPPDRTSLERGELAAAFSLMLAQTVSALLWDMWHDNHRAFAQFPLKIRLALTIPALILATVALISHAFRIWWGKH